MACFLKNRDLTKVAIPEVEDSENVTLYNIEVRIGEVKWSVKHRFRDFVELHDELATDHGITKDLLPPKKVLGNRDPVFVEKRRKALEVYLGTVVSFLQQTMPRCLAVFLHFNYYEIMFLLQDMAMQFFREGDLLLQASSNFSFTPLQLFAISERLKQPCPPSELVNKVYDFSHVLDFCCQLTGLTVRGGHNLYGSSNIDPKDLPFDLSPFKEIHTFQVYHIPMSNVKGVGCLRDSVVKLDVHFCHAAHIGDILLCDELHKNVISPDSSYEWKKVTEANFSHNDIREIDPVIKLIPKVENLYLNHNRLSDIHNITSLPNLSHLYLAGNCFTDIENLHTKVGNIVYLDLSQNTLKSMQGFQKLYSLEGLHLGFNQICDLNEVQHIGTLPVLENLVLIGNPVATMVDYRAKVLEQFGKRASCICLDNEKSTQKELDFVAVLQAIRIVKEGGVPTFSNITHNVVSSMGIAVTEFETNDNVSTKSTAKHE